ncbi:MAG: hypothetical protein D6715_02270 [Calditrichaeota bacterium]|nr:MAG: hypothetical protein D6715_02270 [Calditrichota bacterium]
MRCRCRWWVLWVLGLWVGVAAGQGTSGRTWVFFTDKGGWEQAGAESWLQQVRQRLSKRAWQRRLRRAPESLRPDQLWQDLPVWPAYLQALRRAGVRVHRVSRWLNAASVSGTPAQLQAIARLPFVKRMAPVRRWRVPEDRLEKLADPAGLRKHATGQLDYGFATFQMNFHRIPQVHEAGLSGQGVVVGVFDTGFNLDHPALAPLQDQVLGEFDFIQNDSITHDQPGDQPGQDAHGTLVLSVLAGFDPGKLVGVAFSARFVLAKTEDIAHERHVEEDNWARAAEWADSLGVDLVSTSLGYSQFDAGEGDYTYADMDGQTTIVTRAANFLADRGVLVVSAAGNEGNRPWHFITAPGDGRWVLTVGAVDTSNRVTPFSSRGPTADGRTKPDVVALGARVYAAVSRTGKYGLFQGTSLSTPITAGICALVLQQNPSLTLSQWLDLMRASGDNQPPLGPDNDRGWGRVDAVRAVELARSLVEVPKKLEVAAAAPNPFYPRVGPTFLRLRLPEAGPVTVQIYNALGQRVRTLTFSGLAGGELLNSVPWDGLDDRGRPLPSGLYVYRFITPVGRADGKVLLIR